MSDEEFEALKMIQVQKHDSEGQATLSSARTGCYTGGVNSLAEANPHILPPGKVGAYCHAANLQAYKLELDSVTKTLFASLAFRMADTNPTSLEEIEDIDIKTRNAISEAAKDGLYAADGSDYFKTPFGTKLPIYTGLAATAGYDEAMQTEIEALEETGYEKASDEELEQLLQECYARTTTDTKACHDGSIERGKRDKKSVIAMK